MSEEAVAGRQEWTPTARLAAANRMRERLKDRAGLLPIAEAAAKYFVDIFHAESSAITLIRGSQYRTLVTVDDGGGQARVRTADWKVYPTSTYPHVTELLRAGRGYVASVGNDGGVPETQELLHSFRKGSCIGAPITYRSDVLGEVFLSRRTGVQGFTGKDLAVVLDLSRQLGFRVGPAVVAHDANNPDWWPTVEP